MFEILLFLFIFSLSCLLFLNLNVRYIYISFIYVPIYFGIYQFSWYIVGSHQHFAAISKPALSNKDLLTYFLTVLLQYTSFISMIYSVRASSTIANYNIACVHPNLIPIGVIMVHFSTYARPCVHPMTCASQIGEACARYALCYKKNFLQRDNTIKMYIYRSLKFNETLRLNRYEKPLSPFILYREFCN